MLFREEDEDEEVLPFRDRSDAGQILAGKLSTYAGQANVVVVGLARGGLLVAFEVARSLRAPLDVMVVRKLGIPLNKEFAIGAIAPGGVQVLDLAVVKNLCIAETDIREIADTERHELQRREQLYCRNHPPVLISGKTVILVDDGVATGSSILAAIGWLRQQKVARVVVATPVIAMSSYDVIRMEADEVVCVAEPLSFIAISQWYEDFREITDDDVQQLLEKADRETQIAA
jgi:putative phosphoribosyl transferase